MTRQNWIHKYVREAEQSCKEILRHKGHNERKIPHHTHKWWKAWYKTWCYDFVKRTEMEKNND